jgi:hypothetical protein
MGGAAGGGSDMARTAGVRVGRDGPRVGHRDRHRKLPDSIPAFVRDPAMLPELA